MNAAFPAAGGRKPDYVLFAVVMALVAAGLVMVYSASFVDAITNHNGNQYHYILRQLAAAVIGSGALLICQWLDYRIWQRYSVLLLGATLVLLIAVLVLPASITTVNGARSWILLGPFSMQPSEVAKLALIIYFANWLSRRGEKVGNVTYGLIPFAVMLGLVSGLVLLQGDLGSTVVIVLIGGVIYFVAGANLLHLIGAILVGAGSFWAAVSIAPYRVERIAAWQDPFAYYSGSGYQPVHALYALASGGWFGTGLGQGRQKFQWLPQPHTDAIFAIWGEELGLAGTLLLALAFLVIAYRGFRIAARAPEPFAGLVAAGLTGWLVFQALVNMAVVTGLIPFTGLTLPFISYGGSSLVMTMVAAGILLSISRQITNRSQEGFAHAPASQRHSFATFINALPVRWGNRRPRLSGARRRQPARQSGTSRRR